MKTNYSWLVVLWLSIYSLSAQNAGCPFPTPPPYYTPNWDWTLPSNTASSPNHWNARVSNGGSNGVLSMGSPFFSGGTNEINDIAFTQDYKTNQGWVLLFKDFGYIDPTNINNVPAKNDVPVFMLYNKYRGLIRLYIFANNYNGQVNYAYANTEWESPGIPLYNNSLLTMGNQYSKTNTQYPSGNNTDKLASYVNDYPVINGWAVIEIPVHFDPNTNDLTFGQRIRIAIKNGISSTVQLAGNISFTTKSAAVKDPATSSTNPGNPNLLDYLQTGKEYLGKVPSESDFKKYLKKLDSLSNKFNSKFESDFSNDLVKLNDEIQNGDFKKFLFGLSNFASSAGGAIGVVAKIAKVYIAKADPAKTAEPEKYVVPTISSGVLTLNGKITTEFNAKTFDMQLPGTKHKTSTGCNFYLGLPYYDCPLGVISVQEMPTINKRVANEMQQDMTITSTIQFAVGYKNPYNCPPLPNNNQVYLGSTSVNGQVGQAYQRSKTYPLVYPTEIINSYQVAGKLKLALNEAAGVEIVSAKAALYFEIEKNLTGGPKVNVNTALVYATNTINEYDMLPDNDIPVPSCANPPYYYDEDFPSSPTAYNLYPYNVSKVATVNRYYKNRLREHLQRGFLQLAKPDPIGLIEFQTPFVDIDKFNGTSITLPGGIKPSIKIFVILKPTDPNADQTPITHVMTYEIPQNKFNVINTGTVVYDYPFTCEQMVNDAFPYSFTNNPLIGAGLYQNHAIKFTNFANWSFQQVIDPNGGTSEFKAVNYVKVNGTVKTSLANGGNIRMYIGPVNTCPSGGNAYQVDKYFATCNPDPLARLIGNGGSGKETAGAIKPSVLDKQFDNIAYLYPNPNNGVFTLFFRNNLANVKLAVVNELGIVIHEQLVTEVLNQLELNLPQLKSGIYFINILSNDKTIKPIKFVVY